MMLVECTRSEKRGATGMMAMWCGGIVMVMVVTSLVPNLLDVQYPYQCDMISDSW